VFANLGASGICFVTTPVSQKFVLPQILGVSETRFLTKPVSHKHGWHRVGVSYTHSKFVLRFLFQLNCSEISILCSEIPVSCFGETDCVSMRPTSCFGGNQFMLEGWCVISTVSWPGIVKVVPW